MSLSTVSFMLLCSFIVCRADKPTCKQNDYHFEYTECDSEGGRWRVYVPQNPDTCTPSDSLSKPPVRGKSCTFTCAPGQFMDVQKDQECHACPAGTFSLGGGERFDDFTQLPHGFSVATESYRPLFDDSDEDSVDQNCTAGDGWSARGSWMSVQPQHCAALLRYTVTLVKPGRLSFQYLHRDAFTTFFLVKIKTAQCDSEDAQHSHYLRRTKGTEWKTIELDLKSGLNVITWEAKTLGSSIQGVQSQRNPLLLKRIELEGVAFSSSCTPCKAGTHSSAGAKECELCPADTFAAKGSAACSKCDEKTEYAMPGSEKCLKKPACKETDYFDYLTECDEDDMTRTMYKWIEPQICLPGAAESVKLPASGAKRKCPDCNPGYQRLKNGTCEECSSGSFSSGGPACARCPPDSAPRRGYYIKGWRQMPKNMVRSCMSLEEKNIEAGCGTEEGWELKGDHLTSGTGHSDDAYLMLALTLPGFDGVESVVGDKAAEVARITFVMETVCEGPCRLHFFQENVDTAEPEVLNTYEGSNAKQQYTFIITSPKKHTFLWMFEKKRQSEDSSSRHSHLYSQDVANIYSINVTNVLDAGADSCRSCSGSSESCVRCPDGTHQPQNSTQCVSCPKDHVTQKDSTGRNRCVKCPSGLGSKDGKTCGSDCRLSLSDGRRLDFTALNNGTVAKGQTMFSESGSQIVHAFNISLCDADGKPPATCSDNLTSDIMMGSAKLSVRAFICRITLFPGKKGSISTQPFVIGSHLGGIIPNASLLGTAGKQSFLHNITDTYGFQLKNEFVTFFTYVDASRSRVCQTGRQAHVLVVCDLNGDGIFQTSPKCPEGTCDGCEYAFLVRSPHGCPLCREEDSVRIEGACKFGKQTVFIRPPLNCYNASGPGEMRQLQQSCPLLPVEALIGIGVAGLLGMILLVLLCKFHRRNRNLEYKYMKLVESTGRDGKPGELPAAETCGISDTTDSEPENEDFDRVAFQKSSRGRGFFSRVAKANKGIDQDLEDFETVKLTDSRI